MIKKDEIEKILVYDFGVLEKKDLTEYTAKDTVDRMLSFKYVLFCIYDKDGPYSHFLRLSKLEEGEKRVCGDSVLTILGRTLKELVAKRDLVIGDIMLGQNNRGIWIIEEIANDYRNDPISICAEASGVVSVNVDWDMFFYKEDKEVREIGIVNVARTDDDLSKTLTDVFNRKCRKTFGFNSLWTGEICGYNLINPAFIVPIIMMLKKVGNKRAFIREEDGDTVLFKNDLKSYHDEFPSLFKSE